MINLFLCSPRCGVFKIFLIVIFRCVSECESSAFGCCFVSANGLVVDVCQCCCLLMFVCLPLSRHFPCCKTW